LDVGCWVLGRFAFGCWLLDVGYWFLVVDTSCFNRKIYFFSK
jgi:hypothetical protein